MPITGEYSWVEKKDQIKVSIPLKGINPSKVDILVAKRSLKVNYAPYILDLVLFDEVDPIKHKAIVKEKVLTITLFKGSTSNHYIWGELLANVEDKDSIKKESIQSQEKLEGELEQQRKDRRVEEERNAVRKQMNLDEMERTRLEEVKQEEKNAAEKDLYETFSQLSTQTKTSTTNNKKVQFAGPETVSTNAMVNNSVNIHQKPSSSIKSTSTVEKNNKSIFDDNDIDDYKHGSKNIKNIDLDIDDDIDDSADEKSTSHDVKDDEIDDTSLNHNDDDENIRYVPPPRNVISYTNNIEVSNVKQTIHFTPRIFPTPMRESKLAEEEDWIAKNRRHLKQHGVLGKNLKTKSQGKDISEEDSVWLKAKADDFFRHHDYHSAINAYSAAIDNNEDLLPCYSNRATCYLKLQLFSQCKLDCDVIVEKVNERLQSLPALSSTTNNNNNGNGETPEDVEAAKLQVLFLKSLLKRGTAFCSLGKFTESLSDFYSALNKFHQLKAGSMATNQLAMNINAESIQADIDRLKVLVQCETGKREGDAFFADADFMNAIEKYNEVLNIIPVHVSALSNRAASYMALQQYDATVKDCQLAIDILQQHQQQQELRRKNIGGDMYQDDAVSTMLAAILPPTDSDKFKQWLLRTMARQAVAYTELDAIDRAINVYEHAVKIDPKNQQIQQDLENLRKLQQERDQETNEENNDNNTNISLPVN